MVIYVRAPIGKPRIVMPSIVSEPDVNWAIQARMLLRCWARRWGRGEVPFVDVRIMPLS